MKKHYFILPENTIYMCGHSLGPSSTMAINQVTQTLADWREHAVEAWNNSAWIDLPFQVGAKIAALIGANSEEVILSDSTSVNLYKVLHSACLLNAQRKIILTDHSNFPADLYIMQGMSHMKIKMVKSEDILKAMTPATAVLMLTHVNYRTGQIFNMKAITQRAHELGILVIWDLSHSVGAMPLDLNDCVVDFAVGCTYKYLNGGPGAPSFVYINRKHHEKAISPITSWMSHLAPFDFSKRYAPLRNAAKYLVGTPYVLSLQALAGALKVFDQIDMFALRKQSVAHSDYLLKAMSEGAPELQIVSPADATLRGGHIALMHKNAFAISRALIAEGIVCDYRAPDLIRFCVNPLYLSQKEMVICAKKLIEIMRTKNYLAAPYQQQLKVT